MPFRKHNTAPCTQVGYPNAYVILIYSKRRQLENSHQKRWQNPLPNLLISHIP